MKHLRERADKAVELEAQANESAEAITPLANYWHGKDPEAHWDNPPKVPFLVGITLRRLAQLEQLAADRLIEVKALQEETGNLNATIDELTADRDRLQVERDHANAMRETECHQSRIYSENWMRAEKKVTRGIVLNAALCLVIAAHVLRLLNLGGSR